MTPGRIGELLALQQDLTAVERFAELHDGGGPQQARYYKSLLPAAPPAAGQQYAFEVDLDACSGCKACVTACHNLNGLDGEETWRSVGLLVGREKLNERAAAPARLQAKPACEVDTPSLAASRLYQQNVTTACHHCADPACLNGCPVNAYEKSPVTGIVKHLDDQCIGCQYCTYKCPYGVPQYNPARGIVRKCDMCSGRLSAGEAPACVQACPNEAIRIRVVDAKTDGAGAKLPGAPDPAYTRPTTRYLSARPFPVDAHPQDEGAVRPQHAEWPLVFMLILTQAAVGAFAALCFFDGAAFRQGALAAAVAGQVGLALATLHLGRPLYAYRVILGLRRSWLSREAVVFGGFAGLSVMTAALAWAPVLLPRLPTAVLGIPLPPIPFPPLFGTAAFLKGLSAATAAAGLLGVWCSAKIYMDTPRAWWASPVTAAKFLLTCVTLGPALAASAGAGHPALFLVSVAAGIVKGTMELKILSRRDDGPASPLAGTVRLLTGPLQTLFQLRGALGVASLILLGTAAFLRWPGLAVMGFSVRLVAEILERHLFFVAVVPPRMPGTL